ncbi:MAG: hydrogenase maturation protease [Planctomycetes bacterium]|nr:hydrogenase maturation protease [Planctomycetota bacterium]
MPRIICIGNRYQSTDRAGPLVLDKLRELEPPPQVELIEGGLAGIDLLRFFEGVRRVVLVDGVSGFSDEPGVVILGRDDLLETREETYGHSGGLAFLLGVLPQVCKGHLPEISLVGIEGNLSPGVIDEAALTSLRSAMGERAFTAWNKSAFSGALA